MSEEYGIIKIPKGIIAKIEQQIQGTRFKSVGEYIAFVLEEVIRDEEESDEVYSEEDEKKVKERLKELGYLS